MTAALFTPRLSDSTQERASLQLSPEDRLKITRGRPWTAVVTDQKTGTKYRVRGAACPLPHCMCDAVIVGREDS